MQIRPIKFILEFGAMLLYFAGIIAASYWIPILVRYFMR